MAEVNLPFWSDDTLICAAGNFCEEGFVLQVIAAMLLLAAQR